MPRLLFLLLWLSVASIQASKLSDFEKDVDSDDKKSKDSEEQSSKSSYADEEDSSILGKVVVEILSAWVKSFFDDDDEGHAPADSFTDEEDTDGSMVIGETPLYGSSSSKPQEPPPPLIPRPPQHPANPRITGEELQALVPPLPPEAPPDTSPGHRRVGPPSDYLEDTEPWNTGSPDRSQRKDGSYRWGYGLWPLFQLDYARHWAGANLEGERLRIELGYYALMLAFDYLWWTEALPGDSTDELEQLKLQLGFRIPIQPCWRVDLLGGLSGLEGESNHLGKQGGIALRATPVKHLSLDGAYTFHAFGESWVQEMQIGTELWIRSLGVKAGYHAENVSDSWLSGPYMGLVLRI